MNQAIKESTKRQYDAMVKAGMVCLSKRALVEHLDVLGYVIDPRACFSYTNTANAISYLARSLYINDKKSGKGFANVASKRDADFKELQALRFNSFCFENGRIWEF